MLNVLVAYPYLKKPVIETIHRYQQNNDDMRFLLDSGAFTAFSSGKPIQLDDYCRFIESLPFKPWRYFTLDVIGDHDATVKNYEIMLSRGFTPVPIYTLGQDYSVIDYYYETSDFVGVGGLVGKSKKVILRTVDKAMKQAKGRKIHLLGYTAIKDIKYFRPYTCDSSSWSSSLRFGNCLLYDRNGDWVTVKKNDFMKRPSDRVLRILSEYQIDPKRLGLKSEWINSGKGKGVNELITNRSWIKLMIEIEKKINTRLFLAGCGAGHIDQFISSYKFWMNK